MPNRRRWRRRVAVRPPHRRSCYGCQEVIVHQSSREIWGSLSPHEYLVGRGTRPRPREIVQPSRATAISSESSRANTPDLSHRTSASRAAPDQRRRALLSASRLSGCIRTRPGPRGPQDRQNVTRRAIAIRSVLPLVEGPVGHPQPGSAVDHLSQHGRQREAARVEQLVGIEARSGTPDVPQPSSQLAHHCHDCF